MSKVMMDLMDALQKVRSGNASKGEADYIAWCLGTSDEEAKLALSRISAGRGGEREYEILKAAALTTA